jgi:hypothetical protein
MALTRLKNVFTSKTGRCLYVNSDDFDASDSFDNRGNSPNRPFKTIQRALIEAARFSYKSGQFNDTFESFSIVLYPGDYVIDNRPGLNTAGQAFISNDIAELSASSDVDLVDASGNVNPNNVLYKFNSVEGGVIVPRGTSIVGMDLRKTKLRPLYVPDPTAGAISGSAIFRVTGGCYFWQFSFFDGITGGVYKDPAQPTASSPPTYSHHKLTCFEYADGKNKQSSVNGTDGNALSVTDLDLYYQKVAKAWKDIPDTTSNVGSDELQSRVEENRIVGPNDQLGTRTLTKVVTDFANTNVFTTTAEAETSDPHGFSVGTPVLIEGVTGTDASRFNGSFFITEIPTDKTFRYIIKNPGTGAPSGNPTAGSATVKVEIDNVDSSSPYIFNISLRSTWGMQGMHADGSKATGFKSMVVAQFTGVSLQKDDNAFIKWDGSAYIAGSHVDGDSIYKSQYRNFHVKASNDSVIQAVSVFAVGFADHFVAESGGDQSITNSNSNFGSCALRAKGFKTGAFTQDKAGTVTHIIPPQRLARTYSVVNGTTFTLAFDNKTVAATNNTHGIVAGDYVRFGTDDHPEAYLISAVDGSTGQLTLNRGYRNISSAVSGASQTAYKGVINEIPVGYVALDVQKTQNNAGSAGQTGSVQTAFASSEAISDPVGKVRTHNGNAYLITTASANPATTGASGPTHTSGIASSGQVTFAFIGAVDTRLYLYGYTSLATKPPFKLQGFSIGARKQDVLYVSLIAGSTQGTYAALVSPDGSTTPADNAYTNVTSEGFAPGDANHPIQYDSYQNNWYVRVTAATSGASSASSTGYEGIHHHLSTEAFYADSLFTGSSYMQRVADNRSSRDRTYRMRYVVDNSIQLSRDPINGYVLQARNSLPGDNYGDVYYIYDIQKEQELKKSVQDGIYYMTVLKGSISPTNGNLSQFSFGQNINNLYPVLDKDNPTEDPAAGTSIASNTIVGLVETTDGTSEDLSRSITKEAMGNWIVENKNQYTNASTNDSAVSGYITLEARDGDARELDLSLRMIPVNSTGGTAVETRRPSILRSGNHTFEYVGFGPGNYSTGLPSVQNRVLTDAETLLAQSQKEDAGIAFYSGLNSNGDLFIGNTRISAVTGEEASLDTPSLSIVGETANLRPVFDEIIIRDSITVENQTLESRFKGGVIVDKNLTVAESLECGDLKITEGLGSSQGSKKINVTTSTPSASIAASDGDYSLRQDNFDGEYTGWYFTNGAWAKFGLADTGNLKITGGSANAGTWTDGAGDLQLKNGLGIDIQSTGTLNVNSGATTLGGSLTVSGTSEFNNTVDVDGNFAVRTSGGTDKFTVASATGNTVISGNLNVSGSFTATQLTGTADNADNINVDESNTAANFQILFSNTNQTGYQRPYIDTDDSHFLYNPNSNSLSGLTNLTSTNINATTFTGALSGNASSATQLQTARNIGGVSFNGTADINLPGVNQSGNQDTSGTAAQANDINIDETNTNAGYQVTFSNSNNTGYNRQYIDTDNGHFVYNPGTATLSGLNIACDTITANTFGTSGVNGGQNAYGTRYVSTGDPSNSTGSDGDIWYKY